MYLAVCRREEKLIRLLAWIAKSRLKRSGKLLEIARFGNLAKQKGDFLGFSDSLLVKKKKTTIVMVAYKKATGNAISIDS